MRRVNLINVLSATIVAVVTFILLVAPAASAGEWKVGEGKVYVAPPDTKVGIGLDSPKNPLEVKGRVVVFDDAYPPREQFDCGVWLGAPLVNFSLNDGANNYIWSMAAIPPKAKDQPSWEKKFNVEGNSFVIAVQGSSVSDRVQIPLVLRPDGSVGIGTKKPKERLTVDGKIHTEDVIVDSQVSFPDLSLENNKMLSLGELESYIKEKKRLPGIPSSKEVKEKGMSLSDMIAKQMKKINELTLYMIEIKKENKDLKARINALEKKE